MSTFYSGIVSESTVAGSEKISVNGMIQTRQVLTPTISASQQIYMPSIRTLSTDPVPSNLFAGTTVQRMTVRSGAITSFKHLHLRISVTVTGAPLVLAPVPFWFSQIVFRTSTDNGLISTMLSDTTAVNMGILIGSGKIKSFYKSLNYDYTAGGFLGCTAPLPPGTHIFYLPLFMNSSLGNFHQMFLADIKQDLYFDLSPSNPIVSGTGTLSVSNISFTLETNRLEDKDIAIFRNRYKTYSSQCTFLEPIVTPFSNQVLNLGASNLLNLNNLQGLCAFQMVVIRAAGTRDVNTGAATFNYLNIGDNEGASIDLVDNLGNSIWANGGTGVSTKFMRTYQAAYMCDSAFLATKPVYNVTFCDDIRKALLGQVKGAFRFNGTNVQLSLTLPAANAVQEIQTVTFSAIPSGSGFYRLSFRGEVSIDLAAGATPAQIAAAFAGMKTASSQYYSLVASGPLGAGLTTTLTFTHPATSGLEGDLVTVLSDGMGASVSTVRTLAGTAGLVTGGAYDVHIYSYMYRNGYYIDNQFSATNL